METFRPHVEQLEAKCLPSITIVPAQPPPMGPFQVIDPHNFDPATDRESSRVAADGQTIALIDSLGICDGSSACAVDATRLRESLQGHVEDYFFQYLDLEGQDTQANADLTRARAEHRPPAEIATDQAMVWYLDSAVAAARQDANALADVMAIRDDGQFITAALTEERTLREAARDFYNAANRDSLNIVLAYDRHAAPLVIEQYQQLYQSDGARCDVYATHALDFAYAIQYAEGM